MLIKLVSGVPKKELRARFYLLKETISQTSSQALPDILIEALVQAEDRRFFSHPGYDLASILRALYRIFFCGKREGASTIEQQLVRTLTNDRAPLLRRKVREIISAIYLAKSFRKRDIAISYLMHGYFGWCNSGVYFAAHSLGIDLKQLSSLDACTLVARLRYPSALQMRTHERGM